MIPTEEWIEEEVEISELEELLKTHDINVLSPDGWVEVTDYVDKGEWDEYALVTQDKEIVYCNENHFFQTRGVETDNPNGWVAASDLVGFPFDVLTEKGWIRATVLSTGRKCPIVDINVNHENHRYYTNGVSSHNTGVGKSLAMCHFASHYLSQGKNVLYITMEMSEERIAQRIDANLFDINIQNLEDVPETKFNDKVAKIKSKTHGKLIIKEFPTGSAHAGHFRALLNEIKLKKDTEFDVIFIDYLNICASARFRGSAENSYGLVKAIAEEIRGLAVEFNLPIWTATQTNREGSDSSDPELTNVSESFGLPATADLFLTAWTNEQLDNLGQIMFKQLKNRYNDVSSNKRFAVGIDRAKMRLYDVDDSGQQHIVQNTSPTASAPVAEQPFGTSMGDSADWGEFKF